MSGDPTRWYIKVEVCERKCGTAGHVFLTKKLKCKAYREEEQACVSNSKLKIPEGDFMC